MRSIFLVFSIQCCEVLSFTSFVLNHHRSNHCEDAIYKRNHVLSLFSFSTTTSTSSKLELSSSLSPSTATKNEYLDDDEEINESTQTNTANNNSHDNFDYLSHWYPVTWARDLQLEKPSKVTLFDVDYVVAKVQKKEGGDDDEEVIAMIDICPHKSAALSEGRITKGAKSFQCAYHGWTFDSKTGECIDIPQVAPKNTNNGGVMRSKKRESGIDLKANGVAVPAMIVHGMVWIFPGGGLEEALLAPPPPTVPELEKDGFRLSLEIVRDFPIDWTILIENIMDPDHGLFAHQDQAFDLYSASRTNPQTIEEATTNNGKGWTITSKVDNTYELLQRNEEEVISVLGQTKKKRKYTKKEGEEIMKSTTTFIAPSMIYMGRRNDKGEGKFATAFFITPTGVGKSRFMACSIAKIPRWINIPRWIGQVIVNNFLDQDTYLLATQQRHVLALESQLTKEIQQGDESTTDDSNKTALPVRKRLYNYRSPTEKLGSKVGNWLDSTISRVPNRTPAILALGGYKSALKKLDMTRREVLDRHVQHTSKCKDSMDFVRFCKKLRRSMTMIAILPVLLRTLMPFGTTMTFLNSFLLKVNSRLSPSLVLSIWAVSGMVSYLCKKLENEFKFKYAEEYRNRDMDKVPSVWMDRL